MRSPSTAMKSSPHSPPLEKVLAAVKTQHNQTFKKKILDSKERWCIHSRVEETQGITGSFPSPLSLHLTDEPTPGLHPECIDNPEGRRMGPTGQIQGLGQRKP